MCHENRLKRYKYILLYIVFCTAGIILIWNIKYKTQIDVYFMGEYNAAYQGTTVQIHYDTGNGFDDSCYEQKDIFKRHVEIECPSDNVEGVSIRLFSDDEIAIERLAIRNGVFDIKTYSGKEFAENSNISYISNSVYNNNSVILTPANKGWYIDIEPNGQLEQEMCYLVNSVEKTQKVMLLLVIIIMAIVAFMLFGPYKAQIYDMYYQNRFFVVSAVLVVIAWGLVIIMAGFSGVYVHPDEDVSRMAIDYYVTNWKLPDFSSEYVKSTFSDYGYTRLKELTVYYFLAGKFCWIFKNVFGIATYFRSFNVFLFGVMVVMYFRYGAKCPWMLVGIAPTPQLWYIFSYATSDAWDYFLGFIIIFMIVNKASKLNAALDGKNNNHYILILTGVLFGLLYLGKKNYLVVFLIAFILFLIRLTEMKKNSISYVIMKYIVIVVSFTITVVFRKLIDYIYYGGLKDEILRNLRIEKQTYNYVSYKDSGNSLIDLFFKSSFLKESYESFTGRYGRMDVCSDKTYHLFIGIMYAALIYMMVVAVKKSLNSRKAYMYGALVIVVFSAIIFMSGIQSWKGDFQAQGRYILPAAFSVMPLAREQTGGDIKIKRLACGVIVLSIYSFAYFGICNLV